MDSIVVLTRENIEIFCNDLTLKERSVGTIKQYQSNLLQLWHYLPADKMLNRDVLLSWKQELADTKAIRTVNSRIAAINAFLDFIGRAELKLKTMKYQRQTFSEDELTQDEFQALVRRARDTGDDQTVLLLNAMSGTGVRVSEVPFLTVEAARSRMAVIRLKGKTRQIPLGNRLCLDLLAFARKRGIRSGPIFLSKRGNPLDRRRIWERMKKLCEGAHITPEKVHPHALRHLFARFFYKMTQDIAKLADLLGHSSIETTRIYIMTSCHEHRELLDRLTEQMCTKKPPRKGGEKLKRT